MDKKKFNSKKVWLLIILISIILVPAFYGFTYLKSYWSNSTTINKVPVAVVNLDQPYTKDGKTYDIGNTVVNNLKSNKVLNWKFVNYNEAKDGLYGTKYYAAIVIPKNFSEEIANASTDGFKKPEIDFYQNQGKNFIFSEISTVAATGIQKNISQSISKSVSSVLVQTIYKTKDGFKSAKDGTNTLVSGMDKLKGGSSSLVNGMNKLSNGSQKIEGGTKELADGSSKLATGANALYDGSKKLSSGMGSLENGSEKLAKGMGSLQVGSEKLVNGMNSLSSGSERLETGVNKLQNGATSLEGGLNKLQVGANGILKGQEGINEEIQAVQGLLESGKTTEANNLLKEISNQEQNIKASMSSLSSGIDNAKVGSTKINDGLNVLGSGASSLNEGINSAKTGATQINNGIGETKTGAIALNNGIKEVNSGASSLNNGIGTLKTGAVALNTGLKTDATGASALNDGIVSAETGASKLNEGMNAATTGVSKLNAGLTSGYNNLNNNVKFTAENMSDFISNPVVLNTIEINPVNSYGAGFAPYFMCIALWIGVLYVYFMVSALSRKFKGSFKKRFIKMYVIGVVMSIIQAVLMSTAIYYGLGIHSSTPVWFYVVNILTSVAIFSFMNGLHYIITSIMKGALVVIMVLQFTACGGSYPVAVMPAFYGAIHPFLILSYGVETMRMAISGMNYTVFNRDILILVMFIIGSTVIGFLVGYLRNHITHKRVMKERSELIKADETFNQFV